MCADIQVQYKYCTYIILQLCPVMSSIYLHDIYLQTSHTYM